MGKISLDIMDSRPKWGPRVKQTGTRAGLRVTISERPRRTGPHCYRLHSECSVSKSCPTLCESWTAAHQTSLSFPISEFAQTYVH